MSSIYDWSSTALDNAHSDQLINWSETMRPSFVNQSARVMMQRLAEFLTDLGGTIVASGTKNHLLVQSKSPITKHYDGFMLSFRALYKNDSTVTIALNHLAKKYIYIINNSGICELSAGEIQPEGIYMIVYSQRMNKGEGGFLLLNPTTNSGQADRVPVGTLCSFAMTTAPDGWLICDGRTVSRTLYATLFAIIGTKWGHGNGLTTFTLPQLSAPFSSMSSSSIVKNSKITGATIPSDSSLICAIKV